MLKEEIYSRKTLILSQAIWKLSQRGHFVTVNEVYMQLISCEPKPFSSCRVNGIGHTVIAVVAP